MEKAIKKGWQNEFWWYTLNIKTFEKKNVWEWNKQEDSKVKNGRIAGTGSYVPETIWKNEDLEKMVDTSDIWIRERTGIGARHIAQDRKSVV